MKISMLGWESVGLRCPDLAIDLTQSGKVPKVSLVQMPNGTGKTTTLELIKTALNGTARDWGSSDVRRFRRAGEQNDEGRFVLRLMTDGDPLTFELLFDFLEERVTYRTTAKSAGGVREGWLPPVEVRRFLNDQFVQLFIFDGELAQNLLDPAKSKASSAIDTLCQLGHLNEIEAAADRDWQAATRNLGAKTPTGLASWQTREKRLASRLSEVQDARSRLVNEVAGLTAKIATLRESLDKHRQYDQSTQLRKAELLDQIRSHEEALVNKTREILQVIRQPQFLSPHFAGSLATLKDQFDRVRLPESTSRQFFVELADEATCVCGRPISQHERHEILGQAERYLAGELYSFINNLKGDITQEIVDEPSAAEMCIDVVTAELRDLRRTHSAMRTELDEIENDSIASAGDPARALSGELATYESELATNLKLIEKIDDHPDTDSTEDSWSIRGLESELRKVRNMIAQITGTVELKAKLDSIRGVVRRTREIARERLRTAIREDCNEKLREVLSGDPIQIEKIQQSLSLRNQDGASVGQTLAVGYTFLTTLLERGAHKFPLVVDSPAGPLDDHVREQVGRMIPTLCDQFVAFTISTERAYFLPALEEIVGQSIVYLTAFRATSGVQHVVDSLPSHAVRTKDGVVVSGRDYFTTFVVPREKE
jgi:DNA sulfur modification protein DndD